MSLVEGTNCGFCATAPVSNPAGISIVCDNHSLVPKFTTPAGAIAVTEIGWWCNSQGDEGQNFEVGIYDWDNVNSRPGALLAGASQTNVLSAGAGWKVVTGLNITITAGTIFCIGVQIDNSATNTTYDYAVGGGTYYYRPGDTTLPDPYGASASFGGLNSIYAVYIVPSIPGAPTNLTATTDGANQIDLSWDTPADDGGASITGYQIERESPTGGGWSTIVANTGVVTTTYSNTGLDAVTEYNYRVSAINSVGVGTASNEDSATTTILTPSYTYEEELNFRTSIILMDDGSEIRNSYGTGKRLFTLNYDKITQANKDTLITMYNTLLGMTTAFTWTNPNDDIDYTVRFVSSPLEYTESEDEIYSIQLQLVEVI